jgi:hypothetical protein
MEAWAQWSALFQPGGELVSRLFGRRVQQLALPTRPLDVARGIDSRVVHLMNASGEQYAAGWLRTLSATGEFVYSGCYSARLLSGTAGVPTLRVSPSTSASTSTGITAACCAPTMSCGSTGRSRCACITGWNWPDPPVTGGWQRRTQLPRRATRALHSHGSCDLMMIIIKRAKYAQRQSSRPRDGSDPGQLAAAR